MANKISVKKIANFIEILAQRAFLVFLIFFLLSLIIGGVLFLKYYILVQEKTLEIIEKPVEFNLTIYNEVLKIWQEREDKFQKANFKEYFDPFNPHQ